MKTTLQQWGNSLAARIPKAFAEQTLVKNGRSISLTLEHGRMVMKPLRRRKSTLQGLVSQITPRNRHPETDWGKPKGKEIW